ncbi:MAG: DapH/DapD/GlmU-related protein [Promethearchaeota archaeon]
MKERIHPSAVLEGEINLGPGCLIEAFVQVRGTVESGERCYFGPGCFIQGPALIGNQAFIGERTTIGFPPQSLIRDFQQGKIESPWIGLESTRIGHECIIRSGSMIYAGSQVGNNVRLGHNVLIREKVTIGEGTTVGTGVIIDGNSSIGSKVSIQSNAYIPWNTHIENHVFLGPSCILTNDKYVMRTRYDLHGPILREGVSVGAGAVIMPNIEIGAEAVVGAGAVVTKNVPPKAIVFGVPAKIQDKIPNSWKKPLE